MPVRFRSPIDNWGYSGRANDQPSREVPPRGGRLLRAGLHRCRNRIRSLGGCPGRGSPRRGDRRLGALERAPVGPPVATRHPDPARACCRTRDVAAVAVCSGLLKTAEPGTPTTIAAPVLVVQGTQDEVSPMSTITEVVAEADAAGNDVRLVLLSQTHHAYDNPDAGTDTTARLVYSERSAERMRQALTALLDEVSDPA